MIPIYFKYTLPCLGLSILNAQACTFDPAASQPGSHAIHATHQSFIAWATGHENYIPGNEVEPRFQTPSRAIGPSDALEDLNNGPDGIFNIVSLGRGGSITLTFDIPIKNGEGFDFAIFENGFATIFLELAFVEASSDGVNFFQFPSVSQTPFPTGFSGEIDACDLHQLAGKYVAGYGAPFDLESLAQASPELDVNRVTHIRIVDIVGNGSTTDSLGHPIYDPYPTFGSAGFDLDAVGVIHEHVQATIGTPVNVPLPHAMYFITALLFLGIYRSAHSIQ